MKNYGYIYEPIPFSGMLFSGGQKVLNQERDWTKWLPEYETQVGNGFDTMSCVSFSALNCLEVLLKRKYGDDRNFSDRYLASVSGTTKLGNTFSRVSNAIDTFGLVEEHVWPNDHEIRRWDDYMMPVPNAIQEEGVLSLNVYKHRPEYVPLATDSLYEALSRAPIQVAVRAWEKPVDGVYERTDKQGNHAVTLFKAEYGKNWYIADHYTTNQDIFIKKLSWDFRFWGAMIHDLSKISMSNVKILKDKNSNGVGFWLPATSESAFESLAYSFGIAVPKMEDGTIDWDAVIEGTFEFK